MDHASKQRAAGRTGRVLFEDGSIDTSGTAAVEAGRAQHDAEQREFFQAREAGLAPRRAAIEMLERVLHRRFSLSDVLAEMPGGLTGSDAAQARAITMAGLRRCEQIDRVIKSFLKSPLPAGSGPSALILHAGAAEMLVMGAADHAAVDCANRLAAMDLKARHFRPLINAVLRKVATDGRALYAQMDGAQINTPLWAWEDWARDYGAETARAIAQAHLEEPPTDFSLKDPSQAELWAKRLEARMLPNGSLRRQGGGRIEALPGFAEGAWWIQDAAAAFPVKLLGNLKSLDVFDLCAAPGGKSAQLAAAGANVTAIDREGARLQRLTDNMARLGLKAEVHEADVLDFQPQALADAVVLDAPCSATGTIRRHPDILLNKSRSDVFRLAEAQGPLLDAALNLVRPGGLVIYAVCSLQSEEGPDIVERFLAGRANVERVPIREGELAGATGLITEAGDLRTLPCHWAADGGMDGFYAARLRRLPT